MKCQKGMRDGSSNKRNLVPIPSIRNPVSGYTLGMNKVKGFLMASAETFKANKTDSLGSAFRYYTSCFWYGPFLPLLSGWCWDPGIFLWGWMLDFTNLIYLYLDSRSLGFALHWNINEPVDLSFYGLKGGFSLDSPISTEPILIPTKRAAVSSWILSPFFYILDERVTLLDTYDQWHRGRRH